MHLGAEDMTLHSLVQFGQHPVLRAPIQTRDLQAAVLGDLAVFGWLSASGAYMACMVKVIGWQQCCQLWRQPSAECVAPSCLHSDRWSRTRMSQEAASGQAARLPRGRP